jgi:hypothetical protein
VLAVGGERVVDVAVAELGERVDLPCFGLAPVDGELDGREAGGERPEQSAGVDLGQLVGVADEHDLHALAFGVVEEAGDWRVPTIAPRRPPAPTPA